MDRCKTSLLKILPFLGADTDVFVIILAFLRADTFVFAFSNTDTAFFFSCSRYSRNGSGILHSLFYDSGITAGRHCFLQWFISEMNSATSEFVMISVVFIMILLFLSADIQDFIWLLALWSAHIVSFE